jgi:hypothetical protein
VVQNLAPSRIPQDLLTITEIECKIMGRPKTDARVSIKGKDGKTCRINLVELPTGRWLVYRDGKRRLTVSTTDFGKKMAAWLRAQQQF